MADQITLPSPPSAPSPARSTAPTAIWSLVLAVLSFFLRMAFYCNPSRRLRSCCSFKDSQIRRSAQRDGNRHRRTHCGHRLSTERKEISSEDGKIKVTVSGMWVKMPELNKEATLQVGYKNKEMYLIVLSDAKSDFQNLTLEQHHKITRDRMLQKMTNASAGESVPLTIDGHRAMQDELSGTEKGTNVVFLPLSSMTAIIFNRFWLGR